MHALVVVERARERGADRQGFRARQRRRRRRRRRRRALSACEASRWRLLRSSFIAWCSHRISYEYTVIT